jgi:hypothetical protein
MNNTISGHKRTAYSRNRSPEQIAQINGDKIISMGTRTDKSSWGEFMTRDYGNVQIDLNQVNLGDILLVAPKELVIVGSTKNRLIASYGTKEVMSPETCDEDGSTVCTQCIRESWTWDYLFRNTRLMSGFKHGTPRAYDVFGCRCNPCTSAHSAYMSELYGKG